MRLILLLLTLLASGAALATPAYAARAAHRCNTCHIEPSGWSQPTPSQRRCALHCSSCHVSPSGGGLRTPAGLFFGREQLSTWGERPSALTDPDRYRPEGHPAEGIYSLKDGFSGWWPGEVPSRAVPERYGDIEAEPLVSLGADMRWMTIVPLDDSRDFATFPMQLDVYGAFRLFENAVIVGSAGMQGQERDAFQRDGALDYLVVRELYGMVDRLPWGIYLRGGRFPVSYGWRVPDHTAFSRTVVDLGRPMDRQVFGIEAGFQANYAFGQAVMFTEGRNPDWPGDDATIADGAAVTLGWRDLGWQLALNAAHTGRESDDFSDRWSAGSSWSLNLYPVVYLGQVDMLVDLPARPRLDDIDLEPGLSAFHQLTWQVTPGVAAFTQYEWIDDHLNVLDNHKHRLTLGGRLDPFNHLQLELRYRQSYAAEVFAGHELLLIAHLWL
jgi:hypothetical protein